MIEDFIFVKNVIPSDTCNLVKEKISSREWQLHVWHDYETNTYSSRREKELEVLYYIDVNKYILKPVSEAVKQYTEKLKTGKIISFFSDIRFNRYKSGTLMASHIDHIHSLFDGECKGVPVLSIVGVLNDDFEGGDFICREKKIPLKGGDVLIFPSCFMFPHEVKEITSGARYSFVMWGY
jgi:predicted 2-oxoglutarate/Fe(II)-dependent dioxygenase YbiX